MNKKLKFLILIVVALIAVLFASSCSKSHYDGLDHEGYNVSVKFDANGGQFATNADTLIDSYKYESLPTSANGNKTLYLIDPSNPIKPSNQFKVSNVGFAFTGWYTERVAVTNEKGEHLDVYGNVASESKAQPAYRYSGKWDFNQSVELDKTKEYTSNEPVITLYAGWIREFEFEFYDKATGELITDSTGTKGQNYKFNPLLESNEIKIPDWDLTTGAMDMGEFATIAGKTFVAAYLENGEKITGKTVTHTGTYDLNTGKAENTVFKLYLEFMDGDWRKVSSPTQMTNPNACYELLNDIDYQGMAWAFAHETFTGKIIGNGYTIKNVAISQNEMDMENELKYEYYGLFGKLDKTAEIKNVTFDNITVLVNVGSALESVNIGTFAGEISSEAKINNVSLTNAKLQLSKKGNIKSANASVGLLCGSGYSESLSSMLANTSIEVVEAPASAILTYNITYEIDTNGNDLINLKYEFNL